MKLAKVLGGVGRALITSGVLILLFVAYQLWGTGLAEARAQNDLEDEFSALVADPVDDDPVIPVAAAAVDASVEAIRFGRGAPPPPPPDDGEAVAQIRIPKIGVDKIVVEGIGRGDLKKGPGHYPDSPLPGQPGNAAIAGHRTTYGAPFFRLDELSPGDQIFVTTAQGQFEYRVNRHDAPDGGVKGHVIVTPAETSVLNDFGDNRLTLTTCHPRYSAAKRLIVTAELVGEAATPSPPKADEIVTTELPSEDLDAVDDAQLIRTTLDEELGGDPTAKQPAFIWGLIAALIAVWFWLLGRGWKKLPSYLMGTPVFLVALFVFFENFSRLLPSNF